MPTPADPTALDGLQLVALAALAAWQLTAFARDRDPARAWFAGLLAGIALSSLAWEGVGLRWLGPGADAWGRGALVVLDAVAAAFAALFGRAYLRTWHHAPALDAPLRALALLAALAVPLSAPSTWALGLELVGLVSLLGPPVLLLAGVLAWRAGFAPARHYLLAHVGLLVGLGVELSVAWYGEPHGSPWSGVGTVAGTLVMAATLTRGLAVRRGEAERARERLTAERRGAEAARHHDVTTGLWSRRHLDEHLQHLWRRAAREDGRVALVLVELEGFDGLDETRTAPALRGVAGALAEVAGGWRDARLGRWDDTRLATVLPDASDASALRLAEAMGEAVAELGLKHPGETDSPVRLRAGIACGVPDDDEYEPKRLREAAEQALERRGDAEPDRRA
jgi:diguanylate cyclase